MQFKAEELAMEKTILCCIVTICGEWCLSNYKCKSLIMYSTLEFQSIATVAVLHIKSHNLLLAFCPIRIEIYLGTGTMTPFLHGT